VVLAMIIPMITRTIRRAPSGPDATDEAPQVSRAVPSRTDRSDAGQQPTDLALWRRPQGLRFGQQRPVILSPMAATFDPDDFELRWPPRLFVDEANPPAEAQARCGQFARRVRLGAGHRVVVDGGVRLHGACRYAPEYGWAPWPSSGCPSC
jgi:hypothetical protein